MQYHFFGVFKHGKTFGAVVLVIRQNVTKFKTHTTHFSCLFKLMTQLDKTQLTNKHL